MSNLRPMKHRLTLVAALVLAAVGLSACGGGHLPPNEAESEGQYFQVGDLKYQVQISRQINPTDPEDKQYLGGASLGSLRLAPDQTLFGVFMRVENETGAPLNSAGDFIITDTQGNKFRPVPLDNPFSYRVEPIAPNEGTEPNSVEPAHYAPTQGKLVLFKLPNASLDNRPLRMAVRSPDGKYHEGVVTLDV